MSGMVQELTYIAGGATEAGLRPDWQPWADGRAGADSAASSPPRVQEAFAWNSAWDTFSTTVVPAPAPLLPIR